MNAGSEVRERLAREDSKYQRLSHKHQEYEDRLHELRGRKFLTEEEKLEEVRIKKLKLALKDQMEQLVRRQSS